MRITYIADDGKEFDNKIDCEDYEWTLNHTHLMDVQFYDKDGNKMEDIMSEDTYDHCHKIVVPTDEAVKAINDLGEYGGYCYYSHITEAGTWTFDGESEKFVLSSKP